MTNYWIGVVSRSHVQIGVRGGFIQLNHEKKAAVQRLKAGDRLVMYSPRTEYPNGQPLQAFTAIGTVLTGQVYQAEMAPDFKPYRVDVEFHPCLEVPIKGLLERLSFIKDKARWGAAFRFGYLKVPDADFQVIASAVAQPLTENAAEPFARAKPHRQATSRGPLSSNVRPQKAHVKVTPSFKSRRRCSSEAGAEVARGYQPGSKVGGGASARRCQNSWSTAGAWVSPRLLPRKGT